jgi:hypothetical protein
MVGFELVRSKSTKEPFDPQRHASLLLERAALKRGLVTYPCTGSIDGVLGDMVLMAPPLVINHSEIDEILTLLDQSLSEIETSLESK